MSKTRSGCIYSPYSPLKIDEHIIVNSGFLLEMFLFIGSVEWEYCTQPDSTSMIIAYAAELLYDSNKEKRVELINYFMDNCDSVPTYGNSSLQSKLISMLGEYIKQRKLVQQSISWKEMDVESICSQLVY